MSLTNSNGFLDGDGKSPFGAHADHKHESENQSASTATELSELVSDFNGLLVKMKEAGLMEKDKFSLTVTKELNDTIHTARQANTEKISSVAEADGVITITLSQKVETLEDFDGGNGWGVHKWLGIGIDAGVGDDITIIKYNGTNLTEADVQEAMEQCGLSEGYFVRFVAADLVKAGDNSQKSKDTFVLSADGYESATYKLRIVD